MNNRTKDVGGDQTARGLARLLEEVAQRSGLASQRRFKSPRLRYRAVLALVLRHLVEERARFGSLAVQTTPFADFVDPSTACPLGDRLLRALPPSMSLGAAYQALLGLEPRSQAGFQLRRSEGHSRKVGGAFYTPDTLCECLLDATLSPLLDSVASEEALLRMRILDPAVGGGQFLLGAARRMAEKLASLRGMAGVAATNVAIRDVVEACLFGVDLDPLAVELTRWSLWLASGGGECRNCLVAGNSLLGTTREWVAEGIPDLAFHAREGDDTKVCRALGHQNRREKSSGVSGHPGRLEYDTWCAAFTLPKLDMDCPTTGHLRRWTEADRRYYARVLEGRSRSPRNPRQRLLASIAEEALKHRFLHWDLAFGGERNFDVVLGNPPFVNRIEVRSEGPGDRIVELRTPLVTGAADLAFRFLGASPSWVRPGGYVGFVLPRAALNARSLARFRETPPPGLTPRLLCPLTDSSYFDGIAVYVSLVVLGPEGPCLVPAESGVLGDWVETEVVPTNWFNPRPTADGGGRRLGDAFLVGASMTTGDAYDLVQAIVDEEGGDRLKLLTTGLIEPMRVLWGTTNCRYLKRDYRYPRLALEQVGAAPLRRRMENARRPKVLVAGLGARLEAYFDAAGEYQGAVSTYTITHPEDDVDALSRLATFLCSEEVSRRFLAELGSNALGGGSVTVTKAWLQNLAGPEL